MRYCSDNGEILNVNSSYCVCEHAVLTILEYRSDTQTKIDIIWLLLSLLMFYLTFLKENENWFMHKPLSHKYFIFFFITCPLVMGHQFYKLKKKTNKPFTFFASEIFIFWPFSSRGFLLAKTWLLFSEITSDFFSLQKFSKSHKVTDSYLNNTLKQNCHLMPVWNGFPESHIFG